MQILQNKRTALFNNSPTDMVAPGIATRIAAAREIILRYLLVIFRKHRVVQRLIVIFMHQHRRRHARFHLRVIVRPAKAQAKQRQYVLRELQQLGHRIDIVAQAANIDAAEAKGFRRHQRILRQNRGIDAAQQQLFGEAQLSVRADLQIAIEISAEYPKFSGLRYVLLAAAQRDQLLAYFRVGNANN